MTLMLKLIEYKKYILIGLAMLLSLAIMPAAQVSAVDEDVFGIGSKSRCTHRKRK